MPVYLFGTLVDAKERFTSYTDTDKKSLQSTIFHIPNNCYHVLKIDSSSLGICPSGDWNLRIGPIQMRVNYVAGLSSGISAPCTSKSKLGCDSIIVAVAAEPFARDVPTRTPLCPQEVMNIPFEFAKIVS